MADPDRLRKAADALERTPLLTEFTVTDSHGNPHMIRQGMYPVARATAALLRAVAAYQVDHVDMRGCAFCGGRHGCDDDCPWENALVLVDAVVGPEVSP